MQNLKKEFRLRSRNLGAPVAYLSNLPAMPPTLEKQCPDLYAAAVGDRSLVAARMNLADVEKMYHSYPCRGMGSGDFGAGAAWAPTLQGDPSNLLSFGIKALIDNVTRMQEAQITMLSGSGVRSGSSSSGSGAPLRSLAALAAPRAQHAQLEAVSPATPISMSSAPASPLHASAESDAQLALVAPLLGDGGGETSDARVLANKQTTAQGIGLGVGQPMFIDQGTALRANEHVGIPARPQSHVGQPTAALRVELGVGQPMGFARETEFGVVEQMSTPPKRESHIGQPMVAFGVGQPMAVAQDEESHVEQPTAAAQGGSCDALAILADFEAMDASRAADRQAAVCKRPAAADAPAHKGKKTVVEAEAQPPTKRLAIRAKTPDRPPPAVAVAKNAPKVAKAGPEAKVASKVAKVGPKTKAAPKVAQPAIAVAEVAPKVAAAAPKEAKAGKPSLAAKAEPKVAQSYKDRPRVDHERSRCQFLVRKGAANGGGSIAFKYAVDATEVQIDAVKREAHKALKEFL